MTSLLPLYPCDRCCFQPRLDSLMVQAPREHLGHLSLHLKVRQVGSQQAENSSRGE